MNVVQAAFEWGNHDSHGGAGFEMRLELTDGRVLFGSVHTPTDESVVMEAGDHRVWINIAHVVTAEVLFG